MVGALLEDASEDVRATNAHWYTKDPDNIGTQARCIIRFCTKKGLESLT